MSTSKDVTTVTQRDLALSSSLLKKDSKAPLLLLESSSWEDKFGSLRPDQRVRESRSMVQEKPMEDTTITTMRNRTVSMMEDTEEVVEEEEAAEEVEVVDAVEEEAVDRVAMVTPKEAVEAEEEEVEVEAVEEAEVVEVEDTKRSNNPMLFSLVTSTTELRMTNFGTSSMLSERSLTSESLLTVQDPKRVSLTSLSKHSLMLTLLLN